jgi:alpha-L-rhamnosidase
VFLPTASLNMDVAAFMTKWGDDILDAQLPDGAYPDVAPRLIAEREGAPAWADAGVIVPWLMWRRYGDTRLPARHWDAMERYMAYLLRHNPDLLWTVRRGNDYGDWLSVGAHTPRDVLATAYWAHDAKLMADMARALGRDDRAEHYERLRSGVVTAFNRVYVREAPTSRATPRRSTCSRCTWTSSLKISARERPSDWWRTSSATTSTSPPASSASGSCARC